VGFLGTCVKPGFSGMAGLYTFACANLASNQIFLALCCSEISAERQECNVAK